MFYRIGEASSLIGVRPSVLRYWEREFPNLRPLKTSAGQRRYGERDIAEFRLLRSLLYEQHYTIEGARLRLKVLRRLGAEEIESNNPDDPASAESGKGMLSESTLAARMDLDSETQTEAGGFQTGGAEARETCGAQLPLMSDDAIARTEFRQVEIVRLKNELSQEKSRRESLETKADELTAGLVEAAQRIELLSARNAETEIRLQEEGRSEGESDSEAAVQAELDAAARRIENLEIEYADLLAKLTAERSRVEEARSEAAEIGRKMAGEHNRIELLERQISALNDRYEAEQKKAERLALDTDRITRELEDARRTESVREAETLSRIEKIEGERSRAAAAALEEMQTVDARRRKAEIGWIQSKEALKTVAQKLRGLYSLFDDPPEKGTSDGDGA